MKLKQIIDYLHYKPQSYYLDIMPYRQYIFEVKLKNIENIAECKTDYLLSLSFSSFLEDFYERGILLIDNKHYFTLDIEYVKLIKTNDYYAYVNDCISDKINLPRKTTLENLISRQKEHIPYAKYLTPKKLKELIIHSKNYCI